MHATSAQPNLIRIESDVLQRIQLDARQQPGRECCGLLAGHDGLIIRAYRARNAASNPATEYEIAPAELFSLLREIRAARLQLLGIYHSHPNGVLEPSRRDVAQAYYPDAAYFIISPTADDARLTRAFSIRDGSVSELQITIM